MKFKVTVSYLIDGDCTLDKPTLINSEQDAVVYTAFSIGMIAQALADLSPNIRSIFFDDIKAEKLKE